MPVVDPIAHGMIIMGTTAGSANHKRRSGEEDEGAAEIEVRAPGGWGGRVAGMNAAFIILLLVQLAIGALNYVLLKDHTRDAKDGLTAAIDSLEDRQATRDLKAYADIERKQLEILQNQVRILSAANESLRELRNQTYIMSLSEAQKRELKLDMPADLRGRQQYRGLP